jgi:DNA-binding GntR family transcriptional regulator
MATISREHPSVARQRLEALEGVIRLVIEGILGVEERTSEVWIANQLGLSRTPVREALAILARDGVVVQRAQVGAWVRRFSAEELAELTQVAYQIEILAVDNLVEDGGAEHADRLQRALQHVQEMGARCDPADPVAQDAFLRAETELHLTICNEGRVRRGSHGVELWGIARRLFHVENPLESYSSLVERVRADEQLLAVICEATDIAAAEVALRSYFQQLLAEVTPELVR